MILPVDDRNGYLQHPENNVKTQEMPFDETLKDLSPFHVSKRRWKSDFTV